MYQSSRRAESDDKSGRRFKLSQYLSLCRREQLSRLETYHIVVRLIERPSKRQLNLAWQNQGGKGATDLNEVRHGVAMPDLSGRENDAVERRLVRSSGPELHAETDVD